MQKLLLLTIQFLALTIFSQTTIYTNDFSNPSSWTISSEAGAGAWVIGTNVPSGAYPIDPIASTTAANGYALFDSDLDCSGNQITNLTLANSVNCSSHPNVVLEFQQQYRRYDDSTFVFVSNNNGTTWVKYTVNSTLSYSNFSYDAYEINPELVKVNITPTASGQANVKIRFQFWSPSSYTSGCGYAWMIDDMKLMTPPNNELIMKELFHGDPFNDFEFGIYPQSQVRPISVVAIVRNEGALSQNATINYTITREGTTLYTGTSSNFNIQPFTNETITIATGYTTSIIGNYSISATVNTLNTDVNPINNSSTSDFIVSNNIYSGLTGLSNTVPLSYSVATTPSSWQPSKIAKRFSIINNDTLYAIDIAVSSLSTDNTDLIIEIFDESDLTSALSVGDFSISATHPTTAQYSTVFLSEPVLLLAGHNYFASIGSEASNKRFVFYGEAGNLNNSAIVQLSFNGPPTWYLSDLIPAINLILQGSFVYNADLGTISSGQGLSGGLLSEDFNDQNISMNPVWSGNTSEFIVNTISQLQSNGDTTSMSNSEIFISTPSSAISNIQWEFFVDPKLSTSSNNRIDVFLSSNEAALNGNNTGYFVRIGGTPDEVALFRKDGQGVETYIIQGVFGSINSSSSNPTKVKITRDGAGNWTLYVDYTGTGTLYELIGTAQDITYTSSVFFGILVRYSNSNRQKYFIDNITIDNINLTSNNPTAINFVENPSGCDSFSYQWYTAPGLFPAPSGTSTAEWTLIPGANSNLYDPPSLFSSTSYACFVTPLTTCDSTGGWADGVAQYSITTSLGTISNNGFFSTNNPSPLFFISSPIGCSNFTYQWYSTPGVVFAPSGSSTSGWTLIPGATSNSYDPPTLYSSSSYACFVTPLSNCGSAAWAGGVASFNITTSSGSVDSQFSSQCSNSSFPLSFSSQPEGLGNTTVQWFFVNGSASCPQGNATSGWTAIAGATTTTSSFVPPFSGIYTLACLVTPEDITGLPPQWANGCKTVVVNSFTAQSIIGNPIIIPFNPYTYLVNQVFGNTYSWTAYGGAISSGQGSNQISVFWAATGPYQVMLIENNGECSDTSYLDVEDASITQINETENFLSNVQIFPNPTDVGFTIQSRQVKAGTVVQVYDQMGRMVLSDFISGESTYMNTSALASGIYLLRMPEYPGFTKKISIQ